MREFVAVNDSFSLLNMPLLKQEALMFSRIAIPNLDQTLSNVRNLNEIGSLIAEIDWLRGEGIVFEPQFASSRRVLNDEYQGHLDSLRSEAKKIVSTVIGFDFDELVKARDDRSRIPSVKIKLDAMMNRSVDELRKMFESQQFLESNILASEYLTRIHSIELRELHGLDAFAVVQNSIHPTGDMQAPRADVVEIVFRALPTLNESTPWEQIVEYRADTDSHSKFLALRNWMNKIARSGLTSIEIEQELEYLADQYQKHLALHRMKTHAGTLEAVVMVGAEFMENLFTMKWSQIAKGMFALKHRKIALLEHELTSPGRELAYVMKAKDRFRAT